MNFKVGDLAITISKKPEHHNVEVEVIGPLKVRKFKDKKIFCYLIDFQGRTFGARPEHLRKKPPKEELGSWEDVREIAGWIPDAHTRVGS